MDRKPSRSSLLSNSSASSSSSTNASTMVSSGPVEERHVLFCGDKDCGKTSLIFTLGRGFFPPADILPGRFDGWAVSATVKPGPSGPGMETGKKHKSVGFSLTLWEDRPRMNLFESELQERRKKRREQKEAERREKAITKEKLRKASKDENMNGLRIHNHSKNLGLRNDQESGSESASDPESDDSFDEKSLPPRPLLAPDPDILVLCYSVSDRNSFLAIEGEISEEVCKRYPTIPVILVATKSDLYSKTDSVSPDKRMTSADQPKKSSSLKGDSEKHTSPVLQRDLLSPEMGYALATKLGARIFLECSARDQVGLTRILEECVLALWLRATNPMMAAFMATAESMSGNLSNSGSPVATPRKISQTDFHDKPPLSHTSKHGIVSGNGEKHDKNRKVSHTWPVIVIENQLNFTNLPNSRHRKVSYGSTVKKFWHNVNSKTKE